MTKPRLKDTAMIMYPINIVKISPATAPNSFIISKTVYGVLHAIVRQEL